MQPMQVRVNWWRQKPETIKAHTICAFFVLTY
jgi:hypothetical protein